jgi:hypothetical protein
MLFATVRGMLVGLEDKCKADYQSCLYGEKIRRTSPNQSEHPVMTTSTEHEKRTSILTGGKSRFQIEDGPQP